MRKGNLLTAFRRMRHSSRRTIATSPHPPTTTPAELPTVYQQFIFKAKYARWLEEPRRREHWPETVTRYMDFIQNHLLRRLQYTLCPALRQELETAILQLEVMPSMRALTNAGPDLEANHLRAYNCAYLPVTHPSAFDETFFILLSGTGVGFSVEHHLTAQLPSIPIMSSSVQHIMVEDTPEGWAQALHTTVMAKFEGQQVTWDLSQLPPTGTLNPLTGDRAPGPDALHSLLRSADTAMTHA